MSFCAHRRITESCIQRTSRQRTLQNKLMAFNSTRSASGKRNSKFQDEFQAELSLPEPHTEPSAPLTFLERMQLAKSAKKQRIRRGIAKVRQVGPRASNSSLATLATVEAEPQAYTELWTSTSFADEAARRPIQQARVVLKDSRSVESAEGEAGPPASLRIDSTETKSKFYLHTNSYSAAISIRIWTC